MILPRPIIYVFLVCVCLIVAATCSDSPTLTSSSVVANHTSITATKSVKLLQPWIYDGYRLPGYEPIGCLSGSPSGDGFFLTPTFKGSWNRSEQMCTKEMMWHRPGKLSDSAFNAVYMPSPVQFMTADRDSTNLYLSVGSRSSRNENFDSDVTWEKFERIGPRASTGWEVGPEGCVYQDPWGQHGPYQYIGYDNSTEKWKVVFLKTECIPLYQVVPSDLEPLCDSCDSCSDDLTQPSPLSGFGPAAITLMVTLGIVFFYIGLLHRLRHRKATPDQALHHIALVGHGLQVYEYLLYWIAFVRLNLIAKNAQRESTEDSLPITMGCVEQPFFAQLLCGTGELSDTVATTSSLVFLGLILVIYGLFLVLWTVKWKKYFDKGGEELVGKKITIIIANAIPVIGFSASLGVLDLVPVHTYALDCINLGSNMEKIAYAPMAQGIIAFCFIGLTILQFFGWCMSGLNGGIENLKKAAGKMTLIGALVFWLAGGVFCCWRIVLLFVSVGQRIAAAHWSISWSPVFTHMSLGSLTLWLGQRLHQASSKVSGSHSRRSGLHDFAKGENVQEFLDKKKEDYEEEIEKEAMRQKSS